MVYLSNFVPLKNMEKLLHFADIKGLYEYKYIDSYYFQLINFILYTVQVSLLIEIAFQFMLMNFPNVCSSHLKIGLSLVFKYLYISFWLSLFKEQSENRMDKSFEAVYYLGSD